MKLVLDLTDPLGSAVFHHFHQRNARLVQRGLQPALFLCLAFDDLKFGEEI